MALAGLAALTSLGALLFLAWSLRDIRATPDAIPALPLDHDRPARESCGPGLPNGMQ